MNILDIRCLRGPNYWSIRYPKLVLMTLDLGPLEERPTHTIDGFYERLTQLLPSLYEHRCSEGRRGGFFSRVQDGTWMGHVVEHIALEIQTLAGMDCGFGRTRSTGQYGVYTVVFSYAEERPGRYAAEAAVRIAEALVEGRPYDLTADIEAMRTLYEQDRFGPSTAAIVEACVRRGIPYLRLDNSAYVQLGYGARQQRIQATVGSRTGSIAVELAGDKALTKEVLQNARIPVPAGEVVETEDELLAALPKVGYPLVIKPLDGNHGRGVGIGIQTPEEALTAFQRAQAEARGEAVVVERMAFGADYRLLVVDYKLVAAARRVPAMVTGDGLSTVRELVEEANRDPRRGHGHQNVLTKIALDEETLERLQAQGLTPESIIPAGQELYLKQTANLSTGGTSIDVTDQVHPEIVFMAERAARAIGLDICGIDLMALDITVPLARSGTMVIEVNAGPGLRMHTHPTEGRPRRVGRAIANVLFPDHQDGRIPLIAVTGTNGKTTTTRLTAHLMGQTGQRVGMTTTDGIYIGKYQIEAGDCTGPVSAQTVLKDASVEVAVLECARGGMLRAGLGFDQCDVGIVTNVAADHLGLGGIHTVEDMARVKAIVPESVRRLGYAVLNADNDATYQMRERLRCRVALFSLDEENERIREHCRNGGKAAVYEGQYITLLDGERRIRVEAIGRIPLAFGGKAPFMIANVLAATLAAFCQGVSVDQLARGLRTFVPSAENTPGRMNRFQFRDFTVLVDYAHNPHGLAALGEFLRQEESNCRVGIMTGVGDRRDEDILQLGRLAAGLFDQVIIRLDEDQRGREAESITGLLEAGIRQVDPPKTVRVIPDELKALDYALRHAPPGCLIVHLTEKITASLEIVRELQQLEENYDALSDSVMNRRSVME